MQAFKIKGLSIPWSLDILWEESLECLIHITLLVTHIYQEGNGVADALARHGVNNGES